MSEDKKVEGVEFNEAPTVEETIQAGQRVVLKPEDDPFSAHWLRASHTLGIDDKGTWNDRARGLDKLHAMFEPKLADIKKYVADKGYSVRYWNLSYMFNHQPYNYSPMASVGQSSLIIFTDIPFTEREEFALTFTRKQWRIEG